MLVALTTAMILATPKAVPFFGSPGKVLSSEQWVEQKKFLKSKGGRIVFETDFFGQESLAKFLPMEGGGDRVYNTGGRITLQKRQADSRYSWCDMDVDGLQGLIAYTTVRFETVEAKTNPSWGFYITAPDNVAKLLVTGHYNGTKDTGLDVLSIRQGERTWTRHNAQHVLGKWDTDTAFSLGVNLYRDGLQQMLAVAIDGRVVADVAVPDWQVGRCGLAVGSQAVCDFDNIILWSER